jgi:hypothetical protein
VSFAVVLDSSTATVSRFADSRDAIRARSVSTSDVDVVEEDFRVSSSLSRADLAFSSTQYG